jgi:hypothetical protein
MVIAALSLRLRKQLDHVSRRIDVLAATSVCYRKLGAFPIASAIRYKNRSGVDLALVRRAHAEQRRMVAARP